MKNEFFAADEAAMVQVGRFLAQATKGSGLVFLQGDLGMGKTTLCRGVLSYFGHSGAVKSPTYTLVEPYELDAARVYHFDLYRLGDPEELEYLGIRDYIENDALCVIEWPDKGEGVLPVCDLELAIQVEDQGRKMCWQANTEKGTEVAVALARFLNK